MSPVSSSKALCFVIDHFRPAEVPDEINVLRASRRDDFRASGDSKLHRKMADAAARTVDEHALPGT